jgi:hypothetical protein
MDNLYRFVISDADGVWGRYAVMAPNEKAANKKCRDVLEEEVDSKFLLRPFTLKLMTEDI